MKRFAGVFLFAAITLSFAFAAPVPPRSQLANKPVHLASRNLTTGAGAGGDQFARTTSLRLSQRLPHWPDHDQLGARRASHADGGVHRSGEATQTLFEHLQGSGHAFHGAADLERDRAARRATAGLSRFPWMRPPAEGIFAAAFRRDQGRHDRRGRE